MLLRPRFRISIRLEILNFKKYNFVMLLQNILQTVYNKPVYDISLFVKEKYIQ